ncbi:MAG: ATP-dependent Clp protease ATP-binding subunit ClpX [Chitinophagaceae bacterium]|nr:ATP-dependent Clp protease ATP-binding subunit ClpX [Chitinophagaceae bacterium]
MAKDKVKDELLCSFCLKKQDEVEIIVSGSKANICNECVEGATEIIKKELGAYWTKAEGIQKANGESNFNLKPKDIKAYIDQYVIGQEDAKKVISVAIYNHYKRLNQKIDENEVEIEKSNIMMVGETGTGKTLIAKTVAKLLNVPFAIVDATVFTEAGYVGEDVESILSRLLQAADYNERMAERGIVFIDEIDKIGRKGDNPSITRDVSGEGVQQGMLKLLEGHDVLVPPQGGRKHPDQKMIKINTQNILFICGGAFEGIDRMIAKRLQTSTIGFKSGNEMVNFADQHMVEYVNAQDLRSFGLIPELLGRIPVVTYLSPLDKHALKEILTKPKNALVKQYVKLFEYENVKLEFEDEALNYIVDKALEFKLGGRGLRSICEILMTDAMYEMPSEKTKKTFKITLDFAKQKVEKSKMSLLKISA